MSQLLKPNAAARLILNHLTGQPGISGNRVRQLCTQGRFGQRVGGGWVISIEEIEAFNAAPQPVKVGRRKRGER